MLRVTVGCIAEGLSLRFRLAARSEAAIGRRCAGRPVQVTADAGRGGVRGHCCAKVRWCSSVSGRQHPSVAHVIDI